MIGRGRPRPPGPGAGRVRRRTVVLALVTLALVFAGGAALALLSPWFRATNVIYTGVTDDAQRAAVAAAADVDPHQPLVKVDTSAIERRILGLGTVAQVDAHRAFPNRIVIDVEPRSPVVAVGVKEGLRVADAAGIPFATVSSLPAGVVRVRLADNGDAGQLAAVAAAVAAFDPAERRKLTSVKVDGHRVVSFSYDDIPVTWGTGDDGQLKAAAVRALVAAGGVQAINVVAPRAPAVVRKSDH